MADLKDIFGQEGHQGLKLKLEYLQKEKDKEERIKQDRERVNLKRRKEIMDYLHSLHSDELCQNYIRLSGGFRLYRISFGMEIDFEPDGIYLMHSLMKIPFNDGFSSREMTHKIYFTYGSAHPDREYKIEEMIKDFKKFKEVVSKNIRKRIGRET